MHIPIPTPIIRKDIHTTMKRDPARMLIVGLGNELLMDDGVGIHAVRQISADPVPGALAVEVGTAVLDALHLFEAADRILAIDAMKAGGKPGTIYSFGLDDVERPSLQVSLHELSLVSAFRFLPGLKLPEIKLLGVEPERIDYGLNLTAPVQNALPRLVTAARDIISNWKCDPDRTSH